MAFAVAIFFNWLSAEFRPSGILGTMQELAKGIIVIPYIVGAVFGDNPHNPSGPAFFATLFIQFYFMLMLIRFVIIRWPKESGQDNHSLES